MGILIVVWDISVKKNSKKWKKRKEKVCFLVFKNSSSFVSDSILHVQRQCHVKFGLVWNYQLDHTFVPLDKSHGYPTHIWSYPRFNCTWPRIQLCFQSGKKRKKTKKKRKEKKRKEKENKQKREFRQIQGTSPYSFEVQFCEYFFFVLFKLAFLLTFVIDRSCI